MKPELIVALDVPNQSELEAALQRMPEFINWYKVGLEIFCAEGPAILKPLQQRNKKIFLDLKLHDIPRTVGNAVKTAAAHGVNLMTVHAAGGHAMLEAAAEAARSCPQPPKLVAVTTLTSLNDSDLADLGIHRSLADQATALGELAVTAGIDGLVTSAQEVGRLRTIFPNALLVTPGIRMPDGQVEDQKRVATPGFAVREGASHLVVGRPIVQADDPAAAAARILKDMES
jgi:orotidine-5'-phosphate decarboxylase